MTRFQGTAREAVEIHSIDLASAKPVVVSLDGGSRTELAVVPPDVSQARQETTYAPAGFGAGGGSGGVGGGSERVNGMVPGKAALPLVMPTVETQVPGATAGVSGLRLETKLSADRKNVVTVANPVFAGPAVNIPLPKLSLLPGSAE